jgi:uncharacterized protein DUF6941
MKVTLLLADAAQAVDGKLYVLGGGWSIITVGMPFAIAAKVEVPWNQATDSHTLKLELLDQDGHAVCVPTLGADGGESNPVVIEGEFATGIPAGHKPGTPLDGVFAIGIGPGLPLQPSSRYEWRLSLDGRTEDDWYVAFSTRPPQAPPQALAA